MKKSASTLIAGACLALLANLACADQLADIKAKGVFTCGTLGTAEPFSFSNTQTREVEGYDVDFCKALAKSLGVKLELKLISVAARIPELQQGRVDAVIANLGWSAERAEQIAFSDQYFASEQKVAARKDSGFTTLKDLAGKRVSAVKGSSSEMLVRKVIPGAATVTFQDPPSAFLAMQQGKVEGLAASELNLAKFRQQSESTVPIVTLEPSLMLEPWGIGMRKEEAGFIKHVNTTLQAMEKSGEAQQIFNRWLGTGTSYKMQRAFRIEQIKG
ncbi:ABC transporter substrate-binding protein [Variovorax sp. ZT5P49]|uniref:ABC transporter substrate-binding protein n=1 Tax=Variovorax sp. ZT5P49 TaxID=3443733 RepID=UPI003F488B9D